ncbi:MAG: sterol desaturase family protein [Lysobacteraceae bacterium]|nr:MAG: sterol desaturase family protein [Xanthomonadaceae bacterium]
MAMAERIMMLAIPGFFVLIAIELLLARLIGRKVYRMNDAISSIALGTLSQIVGVFAKVLTIGIYAWVVDRIAVFALPADSIWVWVSGLLLYDFCYYWLHRCGHEVGVLWAAHAVHHQSERFNLSTALRQTSSGVLLGWVFYLPMAVLGYPVEVFAVVAVIDLLYQYWIHTELVPRLGWFDRVFASPSNHRVHHAVNEVYLDKNYGGILILWDRLFDSFIEEDPAEPPVYGVRGALHSWNPIWANLAVYRGLLQTSRQMRRWPDKLKVWLKPPGWAPIENWAEVSKAGFDLNRPEYDPAVSAAVKTYAFIHFVLVLAMGVHFLGAFRQMETLPALAYAGGIVVGLVTIAALLDTRGWGRWAESLRLLGIAAWTLIVGEWPAAGVIGIWLQTGLVVFVLLSLLWLWRSPSPHDADTKAVTKPAI